MSFLEDLPKPFFILAPMDDVTDTVFRRVIAGIAPADIYFTEFVNADGLQSPGRQKLLRKLKFVESETKLVAQLWGKNPENFYKTARQITDGTFARELGLPANFNFVGIDLNMGCPAKSEVQNNTCSALIKLENRELAKDIIKASKDGLKGRLPLSVKTRLGFNEVDLSWIEFLLKQELNMLTIHGRTRKEMSKVPAHWEVIEEVRALRDKQNPSTLVVGNGDVMNKKHGIELAAKHKLDGIMIGRGVFHDPFAFAENSPWQVRTKEQRVDLYKKHVQLFANTWQNNERPIHTLNKFCKIYIQGFDGAKEMRENLMAANTAEELSDLLDSAKKPA
jgi:tRNA-dihydrouridine synthase